jgi:hypothetical protein
MKFNIQINIILTWSKIVAILLLCQSVYLSIKLNDGNLFMFSLPFVITLITGKQIIDKGKK